MLLKVRRNNMLKITIPNNDQDLVRMYVQHSCGHFFDRDTMRFFKSRMTCNYRRLSDTQALFITTEQGPCEGSKRLATVRIATLKHYKRKSDGRDCIAIDISTCGDFNQLTLHKAKKVMEEYIHE
jgi:hypothetical protein